MPQILHMRIRIIVSSSALLLLLGHGPGTATAGHPLATDDSATIGARTVELEVSTGVERPAGLEGVVLPQAVGAHVGLSPFLDVGVGADVAVQPGGASHAGGAEVVLWGGAKLRLFEPRGAAPGLALRVDVGSPVLGEEVLGGLGVGGVLALSWEGPRVGFHVNAGGGAEVPVGPAHEDAETAPPTGLVTAGIGLRVSPGARFGLAFEVFVETAPALREATIAPMVALDVAPTDAVTVSLGVGPVWETAAGLGLAGTLGFTFGFGA